MLKRRKKKKSGWIKKGWKDETGEKKEREVKEWVKGGGEKTREGYYKGGKKWERERKTRNYNFGHFHDLQTCKSIHLLVGQDAFSQFNDPNFLRYFSANGLVLKTF